MDGDDEKGDKREEHCVTQLVAMLSSASSSHNATSFQRGNQETAV